MTTLNKRTYDDDMMINLEWRFNGASLLLQELTVISAVSTLCPQKEASSFLFVTFVWVILIFTFFAH